MAEDVFGIVGTVQGGAFRVEQVVAEGGFAVVYRAHHAAFRASVALKCLKTPGSLGPAEQAEFLEKFREEAELLFRLSATMQNIVRPLHVGTLNDVGGQFVPFIAIEWLDGHTLDALITRRAKEGQPPMRLGRMLELLGPAARALDQAHRFPGPNGVLSIVHRDLKPENIFIARIGGKEVPKILDFGIAKVKSVATQRVGRQSAQQAAISAFTPAYGAPEQWLPKRYGQTGPWTDVWGLALTAVECLAGHAPIDGDQAAMMGAAIDPVRRPTPRTEGAPVSDEVEAVFLRALAVDPRDRYYDVASFWSDLEAAARGERARDARVQPVGAARPQASAATVPHPGIVAAEVPDLEVAPRARMAPQVSGNPPRASRSAAQPAARHRPEAHRLPAQLNALGRTLDPMDDGVAAGEPLALEMGNGMGLSRRPPRPAAVPRGSGHRSVAPDLGIKGPVQMLLVAVLLMGADWLFASLSGTVLRLGPARMFWVAGPLAILGVILLISRLLTHEG